MAGAHSHRSRLPSSPWQPGHSTTLRRRLLHSLQNQAAASECSSSKGEGRGGEGRRSAGRGGGREGRKGEEGEDQPAGILERSTFVAGQLPGAKRLGLARAHTLTHTHTQLGGWHQLTQAALHKARQRKVAVVPPISSSTFHGDGCMAVLGVLRTLHFEFLPKGGEESLTGLAPTSPDPHGEPDQEEEH